MRVFNTIISLAFCLVFFLYSCGNTSRNEELSYYQNDETQEINIYRNLLSNVLEKVTPTLEEKKIIYFENFRSDSIKYWALDHYMSDSVNRRKKNLQLVKKLYRHLEVDPILKNIKQTDRLYIVYNTDSLNYYFNNRYDQILGLFNLSSIVFDGNQGAFYLATHFGDLGGGIYVIYIKKKEDVWNIESIETLFVGE